MSRPLKRSFYPVRILRPDQDCCLKFHFHGAAREVIGLLDKKAALDPERFLYWSVDAIVKECHRYKGKPYNKRVVEYVLAFLRDSNVISRPLTRERVIGAHVREVSGYIVSAHDALAIRTGNKCAFVGMLRAPGRWEAIPGVPGSVWWKPWPDAVAYAEPTSHQLEVSSQSAASSAEPSADQSAEPSADQTTPKCGAECGPTLSESADQSADQSADVDDCKSLLGALLDDDDLENCKQDCK